MPAAVPAAVPMGGGNGTVVPAGPAATGERGPQAAASAVSPATQPNTSVGSQRTQANDHLSRFDLPGFPDLADFTESGSGSVFLKSVMAPMQR